MHRRILSGNRFAPGGQSFHAAVVLLAALAASACGTLATLPPPASAELAGQWQQDSAASDNFETKLTPLLENQRRRMLPRHGAAGAAGARRGGGSTSGDRDSGGTGESAGEEAYALVLPPEDPDKVRSRLGDELRPAAALFIAMDGDALEITRDAEPMRRFLPGQAVSRIDSSGAASVDSGWDQRAFVIRAHYTNRSERSWRYELEAGTHLLRVSFEANAPEFGRFALQTRYRRVTASSAAGN
jgi:hypothetical protein